MTTDKLTTISSDRILEEDIEPLMHNKSTKYDYLLSINLENTGQNTTPAFLLHDSFQYIYVLLSWDKTTLLMHAESLPDHKNQIYYYPILIEVTVLDETNLTSHFVQPNEDEPSYASCTTLQELDLPNNRKLKITFIVNYFKCTLEKITPSRSDLYDRLERIFQEKKERDVKIKVNGEEIYAHTIIIEYCSTLYNMINYNPEEVVKKFIDIKDIEPRVFQILLIYLYIGETNEINFGLNQNDFLFDLIKTADRYKISELKQELVTKTIKRLNSRNVIDVYIFADENGILDLKEICMKFVRFYGKEVSNNPRFQALIRNHSHLSIQLLLYIYKN